jgi:hypothetical protein
LNIEILAKIEGKEAKFFAKIYNGHIRGFDLGKKNYLFGSNSRYDLPPLTSQLTILL